MDKFKKEPDEKKSDTERILSKWAYDDGLIPLHSYRK